MFDAVSRERRWHVVMSHPRKEVFAEEMLSRQGFETFVPWLPLRRRLRGGDKWDRRPLFPRYLFVRFDPSEQGWGSVYGTYGVTTMLSAGRRPLAVPRGIVEALVEAGRGRQGLDFVRRLREGEEVRFLAGPFADRIGRLVELDDGGRVRVLLEMLGAERTVEASSANLLPVRA